MKNKKIVTIYYGDDWDKEVPFISGSTRKSFESWHTWGMEKGVEMYRASLAWYDKGTRTFKKSWAYRNGKWIKIKSPIKPNIIFDKMAGKWDYSLFDVKMDISKHVALFNPPLFRTLFDNKLSQYLALGAFMPKSFPASNRKELVFAMKKFASSKVVIKPLYGSGGTGIIIDEKINALKGSIKYPVLVQEFIKGRKGIPGSRESDVTDLRIVFMNHRLAYALTRIAKSGSLFTNFHQGARAVLVPSTSIPLRVKSMVSRITKILRIFPHVNYSLDFMFTTLEEPILIEINTTPGIDLLDVIGDEKIKRKYFNEFLKSLEEIG